MPKACITLTPWPQRPLVAIYDCQPPMEHQMPLWLLIHGAHLGVPTIRRFVVQHVPQHCVCHPGRAISHACT